MGTLNTLSSCHHVETLCSFRYFSQFYHEKTDSQFQCQGQIGKVNRVNVVNHQSRMGSNRFLHQTPPNTVAPMHMQQPHPRIPKFRFRVLIIGRANAGKTSILQRVCETTDSPVFYWLFRGNEKVRVQIFLSARLISLPTRLNLTHPWMLVTNSTSLRLPLNLEPARRAHHR